MTKPVLLGSMLALMSCTYQYRERDAFFARKICLLADTIERHDVELRSPDGPTLRGWHLTPKTPRRHMVFLYGSNRSVVDEYPKLHWLAQTYDMDILVVDFPGYGFSDGSPTVDALSRASLRIFDSMAARWPSSDGPIFVYGHSMGTGFAVYVGINRPRAALILEAPFTSVQDQVAALKQRLPWHKRLFVSINIDPELTRWQQPVDMIRAFARPLLIIHGAADSQIPVALGRRMFEAAGTTRKHFCEVAGAGHFAVQPNCDQRTDLTCLTTFLNAYQIRGTK